jgi:predicted DNA-binding protein (MmcQ/YjbR family)
MISADLFRAIAMQFPQVAEAPHFENTSFQIKKKIFATLNQKENRATIKLTESDQYAFSAFDKSVIYPVPNKWGKHGWTHINLLKINEEILQDALLTSYCTVAPPKLAAEVMNNLNSLL